MTKRVTLKKRLNKRVKVNIYDNYCIILSLISRVKSHNLVEAAFIKNVQSLEPYQ